ncbi:histidine phosphatase superfamily protein, partial [Tanacetum coccineum]
LTSPEQTATGKDSSNPFMLLKRHVAEKNNLFEAKTKEQERSLSTMQESSITIAGEESDDETLMINWISEYRTQKSFYHVNESAQSKWVCIFFIKSSHVIHHEKAAGIHFKDYKGQSNMIREVSNEYRLGNISTGVSDTVSTSMHNMGVCEVRPLGGRRTCVGTTDGYCAISVDVVGVYMTCWYLRWLFAQRMASEIADAGFGFIYICPWYGDLQGLNKQETAEIFCNEQVYNWRRSYTVQPPNGESLEMCLKRAAAYFKDNVRLLCFFWSFN